MFELSILLYIVYGVLGLLSETAPDYLLVPTVE